MDRETIAREFQRIVRVIREPGDRCRATVKFNCHSDTLMRFQTRSRLELRVWYDEIKKKPLDAALFSAVEMRFRGDPQEGWRIHWVSVEAWNAGDLPDEFKDWLLGTGWRSGLDHVVE
jgi:hypothetical protein